MVIVNSIIDKDRDASSHAVPDEVRVIHLHWEAEVDFRTNTISAEAALSVEQRKEATSLRLDIRYLSINCITVEDDQTGRIDNNVSFTIHDITKEHLGQCLEIELPSKTSGSTYTVRIRYKTTDRCTAVQWLPPSQTAGKKYPYLFTQCFAIHARSLVPCQDCPGVEMTYTAAVTVPDWATCLMSAIETGMNASKNDSSKTFCFEQKVPISSYLIAIAVGNLKGIDLSNRCRVWSEPNIVDAAAFEFSQTEEFLGIAEALAIPYQWGRYDVLCLPPSFPYGGAENPCMTFVTPTLLAGDRSLANVIAHEIAHSWTGNLVTNKTWEHFWLNEGWTVWFERKIMAKISGDDRIVDFEAIGGWEELQDSVDLVSTNYSKLVPNLGDEDPDEAYSRVPYEKGFIFLLTLERLVGRERFALFVRKYLEDFKFTTCDSEQFRICFTKFFKDDDKIKNLDWELWFYKGGMPAKPRFNIDLSEASIDLAKAWVGFDIGSNEVPDIDITKWPSKMKTCFLDNLLAICNDRDKPLSLMTIAAMKYSYCMSESRNAEILLRWCRICIKSGDNEIIPVAIHFITTQGRMKYVRPIYRDLFQSNLYRNIAVKVFLENCDFYHPIAQKMIASDVSLEDKKEISEERLRGVNVDTLTWRVTALVGAIALVSFILMRKK